jgi:light-regulated signal transduction histidine kinase (bacteriophytochrome)
MSEAPVTAKNVDLSNCDREQVQYSNAVQPHGCMIVIEEPSLRILQLSANCGDMLGISLDALRDGALETALGARTDAIVERLKHEPLDNGPVYLARLTSKDLASGRAVNLFGHRCGGVTILEFETIPPEQDPPLLDLYSEVRATMAQLQNEKTLGGFFDLAVSRIRRFTGFDRVMAYKFLEDGSGHVIAESSAEGIESYLDLHYPASDIPAPARRLFALSWLRHLPNADYRPIPLVPEFLPGGERVDLSYALLRSVSVMYSGYLKNMGVQASMVMPLMREGALWGLLACNHESAPRHVPYEARMAAEFLAHLISLMMTSKEDAESQAYRLRMKDVLNGMMGALQSQSELHEALAGDGPAHIGDYIESGGAALVTEGRVTRLGVTPSDEELKDLALRLAIGDDLVVATDSLPERYPYAGKYKDVAAGVLALRLSKRKPEYAMWFRPEQARTVHWAGNPEKPVEIDRSADEIRLMPRASFALWKQSVEGRSKPWAEFEIQAAVDLRWAIVEVILARAEETERINRDLRGINSELDSFAYVASHDLKEPLRGIRHLATFLQRGKGNLDQQIETILKLTRRMDDLLESLLQYSRTGRIELAMTDCDLDAIVDESLLVLASRIKEADVEIVRPMKLPSVRGDRARLRAVMVNLIGNAIKYNDKSRRWIEIGVTAAEPPEFYVRDNGIGIAERNFENIFELFRRLHGRDEFGGGTGAGLTIARKTVERHGGQMWVTSILGEGSTFHFTVGTDRQGKIK